MDQYDIDVDREMVSLLRLAHQLTDRQQDRFITYLVEMALMQAMSKVELDASLKTVRAAS